MRVVWSPQADRQMGEAAAFMAADRPLAARRWLERVLEQVRLLATFPDSGRVVPELESGEIRELLVNPYRVVYRRSFDQVEIVTVWHMRRELSADE